MKAMLKLVACAALLLLHAGTGRAELREVSIVSSRDGTSQPARCVVPESSGEPMPLLVLLHSWSGDYRQQGAIEECLRECGSRGWALIQPNFRGPNWTPEACGSELAVADVLDAVDWMAEQTSIDADRVYLVGSSGGGHMSMLMAGRAPERWAGVSAWVGISDLVAWHGETGRAGLNYRVHMEKACGGAPGDSEEVDMQYRLRSPLTHLAAARGVAIDLNHGIHDGHTGSVPVSHSLRAFNLLAEVNGAADRQFKPEQIEFLTTQRAIPDDLQTTPIEEQRQRKILYRRAAGPVRITIFDGGHEGDMPTAIRWLAGQKRGPRPQAPPD